MHVTELVQQYGAWFYPFVFAWTFIEGETIVILAGAAARRGIVDLKALFVCAWFGSFLGDQCWFLLSRRYGPRLLAWMSRRNGAMAQTMGAAVGMMERHATWFILSYRFIYGVRNAACLAIGASSISWGRFAVLNFVAAGLWAAIFAGGGYLAGSAMEQVFAKVGWLGLIVALIGILGGGLYWHRQRGSASKTLPIKERPVD